MRRVMEKRRRWLKESAFHHLQPSRRVARGRNSRVAKGVGIHDVRACGGYEPNRSPMGEDKHHRGMASASRDVVPRERTDWCLPTSSDILELANQQSPTRGGTDGTLHPHGCACASCTLAVISEKCRKLKDFPVDTNGQALVEAIRMIPGHKHLVFEEGLQSAWLCETLNPHVDELVVAGITTSRGPKRNRPNPICFKRQRNTPLFGFWKHHRASGRSERLGWCRL